MKKYLAQIGLIFLALAVVAATLYVGPLIMKAFTNVSYKFVLIFLLLIVVSNILAKIAHKYFEI